MIDKLHFKAHLKDYYLQPALHSDEYEAEGRGDYIQYTEGGNWSTDYTIITYDEHLAIKAVTPHFTRFIPRRFTLLELGMVLSAGIQPRRKSDGSYDHKNYDTNKLDKYWESIPSSYSGLAFNLHDYRDSERVFQFLCPVYLEFHASPAKLSQGHNIFGSDDILVGKQVLLDVLLNAYPLLSKFFDFDNLFIVDLDITYFSRADTQELAYQFWKAIDGLSRGQTRSRGGFDGTSYFGAVNSKLKKLKVYLKHIETMTIINKLKTSLKKLDLDGDCDGDNVVIPFNKIKDFNLLKIYTQQLLDFTQGMIRWEATLKADWLRERGYSLSFNTFITQFDAEKLWKLAFKDLFFLLESKTMIINDYSEDNIREQLREAFVTYDKHGKPRYTNANNAMKTFLLIKECGFIKALGLHTVDTLTRGNQINNTWYKHLQMFRDIGLTDIYLQGFKNGEDSTSKVVPLLIFSRVDFSAQFPEFYKAA